MHTNSYSGPRLIQFYLSLGESRSKLIISKSTSSLCVSKKIAMSLSNIYRIDAFSDRVIKLNSIKMAASRKKLPKFYLIFR